MADNQYVVFKTQTLLDLRSITTFGLNAKPGTKSPIGYFGTGLKMAIAVLLRENIPIRLFIGQTEYEFVQKPGDFRGVEYVQLCMRKRFSLTKKWSQTDLPFTTELAKNWTLWQAFRELESNTRDENGWTAIFDDDSYQVTGDYTVIAVGPSDEFAKVWEERDKIFLPEALREWNYADDTIQVFREPSKHIYYRGIRIMDLDKVSMFTYNILAPLELTEDRTAKYEWAVRSKIQSWLAKQEDRSLINQLLNVTDDHYESKLEWDDTFSDKPSAVFQDILAQRVAKAKGKSDTIHPRFTSYHTYHSPSVIVRTHPKADKLSELISRYRADFNMDDIEFLEDIVEELKAKDI